MNLIKRINLEDIKEIYNTYFQKDNNSIKVLDKLNKLNIFVWPNNSGKSRFMRSIFSLKNWEMLYWLVSKTEHEVIFNKIKFLNQYYQSSYADVLGLIKEIETMKWKIFTKKWSEFDELIQEWEKIKTNISNWSYSSLDPMIREELLNNIKKNKSLVPINFLNAKSYKSKVYIPILRNLNTWTSEDPSKDNLKLTQRANQSYFEDKNIMDANHYVFTGDDIFKQIRLMLLWDHEARERIRAYEIFLSENFFDYERITLTPKEGHDVVSIKVWDEEDRKIFNVWDWIQAVIINTFPLFNHKEELLLFVEEPELYMHPSMQRKLMEVYCGNMFPNAQIFITTHSNHTLDILLDYENKISIYTFEGMKNEKEKFYIDDITNKKNILYLLWIRNSSVFLSNCVIWVEGITDRLYIRKFLELYKKSYGDFKYIEDKHYTFAEYWWGNIAHFDFSESSEDDSIDQNIGAISNNNFLVCDNDWNKKDGCYGDNTKAKRIKDFSNIMGDDNFFDDHREIENLIPYEWYKSYFNALADWRKWKRKDKFLTKEYFDRQIEKKTISAVIKSIFLEKSWESELENRSKKDITFFGKWKKDIAQWILDAIPKDFEYIKLPPNTKKLTEKLVTFIKLNNL